MRKKIFAILIYTFCTSTNLYCSVADGSQKVSNDIEQLTKNFAIIKNNICYETDSFLNFALENLDISLKYGYQKGIGLGYLYIGSIYKHKNINDSAIYYFEKALQSYSDDETIADLYWELADLYRNTGNYSASLEKSLKLKELVEKNNIKKYLFRVYNILGLSYQSLFDFELAFENFQKAADLAISSKDSAYAGIVYSNIGRLFFEQNSFDSSLVYFEKGVRLEEKYKLYESTARSYNVIANIYLQLMQLDSVKFYLDKSYKYFVKYDTEERISDYFLTSGKYYFFQNDLAAAEESLKKAIEIAEKTDRKIVLSDAYKLLSDIKLKINNYYEAYYYLNNFFDIYSDIYDFAEANKVKAFEEKLQQQQKQGEVIKHELEKQKTKSLLLIIIIVLAVLLFIVALIYGIHFKKLNKELKEAKEKAEESDKLKSQFLRTISHEIRTPLNGIIGFSEIILTEKLTKKELNRIYKFIAKNSEELTSTIDNMVDIAYLTTNQYKVNKEEIELSAIFKSSIKQIKQSALYEGSKDVKIVLANNNKIQINSDKSILKKIIKQLIKNALLYTEKGLITVGYDQEKSHIKLFVKDTGIGILQDNMEVIFTPFRQTREALNKENSGTGLGLAVVNEFVKILGGRIWLGSEPEKGSIFFISLPIK